MATGFVQIEELLTEALDTASGNQRNALAQAIEDFRRQQPQAWRHWQQSPYAGILDAIIMGVDARPVGVPE